MSGAMSEGRGGSLRDALVVLYDERAPYNVIICVECGAEECGASFHAVTPTIQDNNRVCNRFSGFVG